MTNQINRYRNPKEQCILSDRNFYIKNKKDRRELRAEIVRLKGLSWAFSSSALDSKIYALIDRLMTLYAEADKRDGTYLRKLTGFEEDGLWMHEYPLLNNAWNNAWHRN